jgi:hypothetical protein
VKSMSDSENRKREPSHILWAPLRQKLHARFEKEAALGGFRSCGNQPAHIRLISRRSHLKVTHRLDPSNANNNLEKSRAKYRS